MIGVNEHALLTATGPQLDDLDRFFWAHTETREDDECWPWRGTMNPRGYGMARAFGRPVLAHRLSWWLWIGQIPEGLVIDHLCHNPVCVNPCHLEPVTIAENTRRGYAPNIGAAFQLAKTHCPHGHAYTPENTTVTKRGERYCKTCQRQWWQRARAKKRDA